MTHNASEEIALRGGQSTEAERRFEDGAPAEPAWAIEPRLEQVWVDHGAGDVGGAHAEPRPDGLAMRVRASPMRLGAALMLSRREALMGTPLAHDGGLPDVQ
jgi:hypothetical protein